MIAGELIDFQAILIKEVGVQGFPGKMNPDVTVIQVQEFGSTA